jgi:hypothetical protein
VANNGDVPAHQGWFDETKPPDPDLTTELLLIERCIETNYGPWKIGGAFIREAPRRGRPHPASAGRHSRW